MGPECYNLTQPINQHRGEGEVPEKKESLDWRSGGKRVSMAWQGLGGEPEVKIKVL